MNSSKIIGYLSGAPRVSTRPEVEATGPRSHVLGIIHAFENKGWEVRRFIVGDQVPLSWVSEKSAKKVNKNYFSRLLADIIRIVLGVYNGQKAIDAIGEVDFIYERLSAFQALGRKFQKKSIPWILETNALLFKESGSDRKSMLLTGLARKIELNAYRNCDLVVCVSSELKKVILENLRIPEERIFVLPNAVDIRLFKPAHNNIEWKSKIPVLGFVGLVANYQGLETLIRALAELQTEGVSYKLVIVGEGPEKQKLEGITSQLDLIDLVEFTGRVPWEKVPALISGFDICYSGQESIDAIGSMYLSPLKLYEYGAMGKPIIASDNEDAKKLINEDTGYLFETSKIASLKEALRKAYGQQETWAEKGTNLRTLIERKHSWDSRIDQLLTVIKNLEYWDSEA